MPDNKSSRVVSNAAAALVKSLKETSDRISEVADQLETTFDQKLALIADSLNMIEKHLGFIAEKYVSGESSLDAYRNRSQS